MLDTIRVKLTPSPVVAVPPDGWLRNTTVRRRMIGQKLEETEGLMFQRDRDALRVGGGGAHVEWAEVSLPRCAGHESGKDQLSRDEDLEMALYALKQGVRQVAPEAHVVSFTRADIAWQWKDEEPAHTLSTLAYLRHPRVRKPVQWYAGQSVHWPGEDLHIRVYDARREMQNRAGDVLRVEAQLRGDWVKRLPPSPSLAQCFKLLREAVMPLQGVIPKRSDLRPRIADLLAVVEHTGVLFPGTEVPVARWFLEAQSRATRYRLLRNIRDSRIRAQLWSWDDVLPTSPPPADQWVNLRLAA